MDSKKAKSVDRDNKSKNDLGQPLAEYSEKDRTWDVNRSATQSMSDFLTASQKFERWAERMNECTQSLGFGEIVDNDGVIKPKLLNAFFCHCRHCQTCDSRKSLVRMGRFRSMLPNIEDNHKNARWIMLTLTVPNCHINELKSTLKRMSEAWRRFVLKKPFSPVLGWIRATEVTQEQNRKNYAHPHYHILLLVPPSMASGVNYVKHETWLQMWRDCYRDQSITAVNVQAVKGGAMRGAIETLKAFNYSIKVDDLINRSPDWVLEYMEQVKNLRFISTGGALKNALKNIDNIANDEMIFINENGDLETGDAKAAKIVRVATWRKNEKIYRMKK